MSTKTVHTPGTSTAARTNQQGHSMATNVMGSVFSASPPDPPSLSLSLGLA
jgi:hypothetical protein